METYKGLPLYQITIDEEAEEHGVKIMSIVDLPAVQSDFLKFGAIRQNYSLDEEKRIVTGCALRAAYPIYRKDATGREFYVTFSADYIEKIVQKFMREGLVNAVNLMHSEEQIVDGVYLFESYLLTREHTLTFKDFKNLEPGSWMVSYKVDNDKVWKLIKEGKLKGFSVEINAMLDDDFQLRQVEDTAGKVKKLQLLYYLLKTFK